MWNWARNWYWRSVERQLAKLREELAQSQREGLDVKDLSDKADEMARELDTADELDRRLQRLAVEIGELRSQLAVDTAIASRKDIERRIEKAERLLNRK